jgi:hypothetical protein
MATVALRALEQVKTIHGNSPFTGRFPEAASSTWKRGAILEFNSSGHLVEASTPSSGTNAANIVGVSAEDAHNDSTAGNSYCTVWIADDETIFCGNLVEGTNAAATAITMIGVPMGLRKITPNWHVDKQTGGTTLRRVIVVDLDGRDNVGDVGGRVHFLVMGPFRRLDASS